MDKRVNNILRKLCNKGYECYIVGGYVRDYLLGKNTNDYDLCTNATIRQLQEILRDYPIKGINYNTMVIEFNDIKLEITPYRREILYDNRKPIKYELVNTLSEDIGRRDFTINTICLDYNNNVIDLLNGEDDLKKRIIKSVGNPEHKIQDDPLRILRALRFSALLEFSIDRHLEEVIIKYGYLVKTLSYDRKRQEINYLIKIRRLDLLKKYALDKYLDIKIDKVIYYDYDILIWRQLDYQGKYCITKKEKKILKKINELESLGLTDYNIYKYGLDISSLVAQLKGTDILERYKLLPIKKRGDIAISSQDILNVINKPQWINDIYIHLENMIINRKLINEYSIIMSYLQKIKHTIY